MKQSNNYISASHALSLITKSGYKFNQTMDLTEFSVIKEGAVFKLNQKAASEVKKALTEMRKQQTIWQ